MERLNGRENSNRKHLISETSGKLAVKEKKY
jgi:hypothetical protein